MWASIQGQIRIDVGLQESRGRVCFAVLPHFCSLKNIFQREAAARCIRQCKSRVVVPFENSLMRCMWPFLNAISKAKAAEAPASAVEWRGHCGFLLQLQYHSSDSSVCYGRAKVITSLGDGQILKIDHDVALPGEDSNKISRRRMLGGRETEPLWRRGGRDMSVCVLLNVGCLHIGVWRRCRRGFHIPD